MSTHSDYDILEEPIRGEIFSPERLEQYAIYLADHLEVSETPTIHRELLLRVEENCQTLIEIYKKLTSNLQNGKSIPFAGEWLVDNFFIIEDQIREIRQDLPKKYYDELPKIKGGDLEGFPRIYSMALTLIAHLDSHLEIETIKRFTSSFQTMTPLRSGELWAIPITLRIALIENLRRLMVQIIHIEELKEEADRYADIILEKESLSAKDQKNLCDLFCKSNISDCVCIAQLSKRLRDHSPGIIPIYDLITKQLQNKNITIEEAIHADHLLQAITQVTVGNIVTSMRLLSNSDWQEFFESVSLVDTILNYDPLDIYRKMDFSTRDRYRHAIERLSKKTKIEELDIASEIVKLATHEKEDNEKLSQITNVDNEHVGYYLLDDGLLVLEKILNYKLGIRERIERSILNHPNLFYFGSLFLTLCLFYKILISVYIKGTLDSPIYILSLVALIPLSDSAINLINLLVNATTPPRILPKIEIKNNIPAEAKTFVVVPTIFKNKASVNKIIETLEIHYLSNNDPNLFFAVLSDFTDASFEIMPDDDKIIEHADKKISDLNKRYVKDQATTRPQFFLFHRKRLWNPSEEKWMGFERKRGKLEEFNLFLRGKINSPFIKTPNAVDLDLTFYSQIKYVITLDSDTQMPRDSAKKLIGIILHPSNDPHFEENSNKLSKGYCILQPRISITTTSSSKSYFSKIYSGHTGIDPYTTAVSDVYQDLYGEGSFVGKGLYVVDAFIKCLENKIKENTVLSHDLIEGIFAKTALVTDVEFLDDYPTHYDTHARRLHRWIRGDWQIIQWLFSTGKESISFISRWKIFDNLRRSLVAPVTFIWLILSWCLIPNSAIPSTLIALLFIYSSVITHSLYSLFHWPKDRPLKGHLKNIGIETRDHIIQISLSIVFLPHQTYLNLDAIIRTLYRMIISKKHLLEWTTAAETEAIIMRRNFPSLSIILSVETLSLICLATVIATGNPSTYLIASPFIAAWILSPYIIHEISKKKKSTKYIFNDSEVTTLRIIARRTWLFFETFVTKEDNWLVPDNFQEDPKPLIAHRTSPTNMGVLLLSTASAYDFGYIGVLDFLSRLENTQNTMEKLERMHGHFYNWYDTQTLAPLHPKYISTVDSGNLAAHLITLKNTFLHFLSIPIVEHQLVDGLQDSLILMKQELDNIDQRYLTSSILPKRQEKNKLELLIQQLLLDNKKANPLTMSEWSKYTKNIREKIEKFSDVLNTLILIHGEKHFTNLKEWTLIALKTIQNNETQIHLFSPWSEDNFDHFIGRIKSNSPELFTHLEKELNDLKYHHERLVEARVLPHKYQEMILTFNKIINSIRDHFKTSVPNELITISDEIELSLSNALEYSQSYIQRLNSLALRYNDMAMSFNFTFLYNNNRKIFPIGFNVTEGKMDNSFYDLLASEARVASFFAIAKGDVPQTHWFHLGRQMSTSNGSRALLSWSATMFEYLMPLLIMKNYSNTLLYQTYQSTVDRQIAYGNEIGLPWGVSESAYNARDLHQNFQYGPFGIPGMGLKYGLSYDQVISPYSSALAAMINPKETLLNFDRLKREKAFGKYGFYESIDYTKERLQKGHKKYVIKSFMVHHQGMIIIALDNVLHKNIMQDRFHADPIVKATELLLQEKIPEHSAIVPYREERPLHLNIKEETHSSMRHFNSPLSLYPQTHILSNGQYTTMLSTTGAGFSTCNGESIHRWSEDPTLESNGSFIYIRDHFEDNIWSNTYSPLNKDPELYQSSFTENKIEYWRKDQIIDCHTEIIVSPEDNAEIKILTLNNNTNDEREIDLTSYMEPVLARAEDDRAHLTFSKMFLETEFIKSKNALLFSRRKRSASDKEKWGIHVVVTNADDDYQVEFETDRSRFIGRGRNISNPMGIFENVPFSNSDEIALDPIISLRQFLKIKPGDTVKVCFTTAFAQTREDALRLIDQYHDIHCFERENEMSWTKTQAQLRHLNLSHDQAHLFQELAGTLIYSNAVMRPSIDVLIKNNRSQDGLWAQGISGDLPILLLNVASERDIPLVRQILRAHEYLRLKRINFDLVIISNEIASYRLSFHDELVRQTQALGVFDLINKNGGIFLLSASILSDIDKQLFLSCARVVVESNKGSLKEQLQRVKSKTYTIKPILEVKNIDKSKFHHTALTLPNLEFFNGLGGFSSSGDQYVLFLGPEQSPPAPWINVIANSDNFGFLISENGSGYTWSANSRENRLTPWTNDPISDQGGEAIYIRDEETHQFWSPTPWPIRGHEPYIIRHGLGYSQFEYNGYGISHQLVFYSSLKDHFKIAKLKLKNDGPTRRKLSITYFAEWVLGNNKSQSSHYIITEKSEHSNALIARNPYSNEFNKRSAILAMSGKITSFTCDRKEFLGRNGSYQHPIGMTSPQLKNKAGAGFDPCSALRSIIEIPPYEEVEVIMLLGQIEEQKEIKPIIDFYLDINNISNVIQDVHQFWKKTTDTIQIKTSSRELDFLMNKWLLYQTLSCRIWARSALYQSGGAFGFRDQLQDIMALVYSHPEIAKEHILKAATHQFPEGDVQHWWHPPLNKGVRTRFSDDLLWLPYVVSYYIKKTGDQTILNENVSFIEGPMLDQEQEDLYIHPTESKLISTLYDHCIRAIDRSLKVGSHGLPLMGAGDWNDGMNKVGIKGFGESVWVAWFLSKILNDFSKFCDEYKDFDKKNIYLNHAKKLVESIESNAWDGDWYMRAFFDDGGPLGSKKNDECKIDSLTQSWSVLTGLGKNERQLKAMSEVAENLVLKKEKLCLLFTPPFKNTLLNPGYIKGYPPGIRENGGQYTHAAVWAAMAFSLIKDVDNAYEILSNINPINRTKSYHGIQLYRVEPYVLSADIYFGKTYSGRGGWSWYTGSSSLYYQAVLEYILGMKKEGDYLSFSPCIPSSWKKYEITYNYHSTLYRIEVKNPLSLSYGMTSVFENNQECPDGKIKLIDDGHEHHVLVELLSS